MSYAQPIIDFSFQDGMFEIPSGHLAVAPINVGPGVAFEFSIVQIGLTQDHSLRCWISTVPNGNSLTERLPLNFWHANRVVSEKVVIHDKNKEIIFAPGRLGLLPVEPNTYIINVLNFVNATNAFAIKVVTL